MTWVGFGKESQIYVPFLSYIPVPRYKILTVCKGLIRLFADITVRKCNKEQPLILFSNSTVCACYNLCTLRRNAEGRMLDKLRSIWQ